MVLGKSLILAISLPVSANPIDEPRFFEYRSGGFGNQLLDLTFGWNKKLDERQRDAYHQSINHAVMAADNGERVSWFRGNASGYSVPVFTWPTGSGYCRRIHIQAIAHGVEKTMTATACYDNGLDSWKWVSYK
jgi:surface antigen